MWSRSATSIDISPRIARWTTPYSFRVCRNCSSRPRAMARTSLTGGGPGKSSAYAAVAGVNWVALTDGERVADLQRPAPVDVEEKLFRQFRVSENREAAAQRPGLPRPREPSPTPAPVLSSLWEADRADRAVREAVDELFSAEPPDWFVAALTKRIDGFTRGQVRAALERLRVRLDAPPSSRGAEGWPRSPRTAIKSGRGDNSAAACPFTADRGGRPRGFDLGWSASRRLSC